MLGGRPREMHFKPTPNPDRTLLPYFYRDLSVVSGISNRRFAIRIAPNSGACTTNPFPIDADSIFFRAPVLGGALREIATSATAGSACRAFPGVRKLASTAPLDAPSHEVVSPSHATHTQQDPVFPAHALTAIVIRVCTVYAPQGLVLGAGRAPTFGPALASGVGTGGGVCSARYARPNAECCVPGAIATA